jgi:hypothetical protein
MVFVQRSTDFILFSVKRHEEEMAVLYNAMKGTRKNAVKVTALIGRTKTRHNTITKSDDASRNSACSIRDTKYGKVDKETAYYGTSARVCLTHVYYVTTYELTGWIARIACTIISRPELQIAGAKRGYRYFIVQTLKWGKSLVRSLKK